MNLITNIAVVWTRTLALLGISIVPGLAQHIPRTWDEAAMQTGILKPPVAWATVTRVTAEYYYRIPERQIYRHYPVYGSKLEPPG